MNKLYGLKMIVILTYLYCLFIFPSFAGTTAGYKEVDYLNEVGDKTKIMLPTKGTTDPHVKDRYPSFGIDPISPIPSTVTTPIIHRGRLWYNHAREYYYRFGHESAKSSFEKAIDHGSPEALHALGVASHRGSIGPKNLLKSIYYLKRAFRAENMESMIYMLHIAKAIDINLVESAAQSINSISHWSLSESIHNILERRTNAHNNTNLSRSILWSTTFTNDRERGGEGLASSYNYDSRGFIGGNEISFDKGNIGLFFGLSKDYAKTKPDYLGKVKFTSININSTGGFIGTYIRSSFRKLKINSSLSLGYRAHNSKRPVMEELSAPGIRPGNKTAKGNYNSINISPALNISGPISWRNGIYFTPSLQLMYSYSHFKSYQELGSSFSNLTVNKRDINIFGGRIQLSGKRMLSTKNNSQIEIKSGMKFRYHMDEPIVLALLDINPPAQLSYNDTSNKYIFGGYVGSYLTYNIGDNVSIGLDIEYARSSGREKELSAHLNYTILF